MASNKASNKPFVKKVKKKQVKDELDRLKLAEKKRRRLEKALATSAAIRSELEKKKQKKKEEQQRLDEEGAAIAESVALHVLLGEDSDDTLNIVVNKDNEFKSWGCPGNIGLCMGNQKANHLRLGNTKCVVERVGWLPGSYISGFGWGGVYKENSSFSSPPYGRNFYAPTPSFEEQASRSTSLSAAAELIAAQAVSSLRIAEVAHVDQYFLNGML